MEFNETAVTTDAEIKRVLVVEDERRLAVAIARAMQPSLDPILAHRLEEARGMLGNIDQLGGAVVDLMLPDGSGLDLVRELRKLKPDLPILILTGFAEPSFINQAHALHAEYVCKPNFHDNLKAFLRRVVQPSVDDKARLAQVVETFSAQYGLSVRQTEILALATSGVPRARIADALQITENTVKTQIRAILKKVKQKSFSDVLWLVRQASPQEP